MAADPGFSRRTSSERDLQPVGIVAVDPASRTAYGLARDRHTIKINCAYATGDTITVPAVGEQWYVERFAMEWRLYGRIPFNDATLNIEPVEGQVSVGGASGPLELNGTEIRANGNLRLGSYYYRDDGTTLQRSADGQTWEPIVASDPQAAAVAAVAADTATARMVEALTGQPPDPAQPSADLVALSTWSADVSQVATTANVSVNDLGNNLMAQPQDVIGNIFHVIMDGAKSVGDFLTGLAESLFGGIGAIGDTPVERAHSAATAVRGQAVQAQVDAAAAQAAADEAAAQAYLASVGTETVSSFFNTPRVLPSWIGQQTDDVAFAYTLIDGATAPTAGRLILIPITVQQDRVYDSVKIGLDGNAMTNLYVGVYEVDEMTGAGTKVIDLGDVKSAVTLAYDQVEFPLATPVSVQRGEVYYIGVLQTGTSQPMFRWSAGSNFTIGIYPQSVGLYHSVGSLTALPSSFTGDQVVSGGTVMKYWGALGILTPDTAPPDPPKVVFSDSFDRANSSSLGASWLTRGTNSLQIYSNKAAVHVPAFGYAPSSGSNSYIGRLTRTDCEVGGFLTYSGGSYNTTLGYGSTKQWRLGLRAYGSGDGPYFQLSRVVLSTGATTWTASIIVAGATKASNTTTAIAGFGSDQWKFVANGSSYTASYRYGGTTWVDAASWTDGTGVWPVASNSTEVFVYARSLWPGGEHSASIDNWYAKDL